MLRNKETIDRLVDEVLDSMDMDDVLEYVRNDLTSKYEVDEYLFMEDWEDYGLQVTRV